MDDGEVDFYEEAHHTYPAATSAPSFYNNTSRQLLRVVQSSLSPQPRVGEVRRPEVWAVTSHGPATAAHISVSQRWFPVMLSDVVKAQHKPQ